MASFMVTQTGVLRAQNIFDLIREVQPAETQPQPAQPAQPTAQPAAAPAPQVAPQSIDTRPAFMMVITNQTRVTNQVIVTNYFVSTNISYATNLYNAQGQLLQPVKPVAPPIPGLVPIPGYQPTPVVQAAPDPKVVRANQLQALKDLLSVASTSASNTLAVPGSFIGSAAHQIQIPEGVTVFDRAKGQALQTAMNTAVEKAAPGAFSALQRSVAQLNPADPGQILQGAGNAATSHLLQAEELNLSNQILPLVQRAAQEARVSEAYQDVMVRGGGLFGAIVGTAPSVDLNTHMTRGLMDAIFKNLGAQEQLIRSNPAARTTKALQEAFRK